MIFETPDSAEVELINELQHVHVGEIQGIHFDLRHPNLDTDVCAAPHLFWQIYSIGIRYYWEEGQLGSGETSVNVGDRVYVHKVERLRRGVGLLADPNDAYEFWAYVGIERPSGKTDVLDEPILFVPKDAMAAYSSYESIERDEDHKQFLEHHGITFAKIAFRIERLLKVGKLVGEKGEWLRLADDMLNQAVEEATAINESRSGEVTSLMDLVATAAYALARAEGAAKLVPLANKAIKARRHWQAATEAARGANMKADTPELLSRAKAMCGADPNLSLTACAKRLGEQFSRDSRNVRQTIKHLFEPRHLPSGRLEYRPKGTKGETGGITG